MSNELVTINTNNFDVLAQLTGQATAVVGDNLGLPRMRINRDAVDQDDQPIPIGTFAITMGGKTLYSKTCIFRPLVNMYQYQHYNSDEKKVVNRTIFIPNFTEIEAIDEKGGVRCGKLTGKQLKALSQSQQEAVKEKQKPIKAYRFVFGYVSMADAADKDGNKQPIDNVLCYFRLNGDNFMPIGEVFDRLAKSRKAMQSYDFVCSLERKVNGATKYYQAKFDVDVTKAKPITEPMVKDIEQILAVIKERNIEVVEKHKEALKNKAQDAKDAVLVGEILQDDFDDAPFPTNPIGAGD
jgi:hypothetical protein